MLWVNIIIQGILVGGLYALFAAGLSLIFGVMRLVNIAHGDLIVAIAYLAFVIVKATGLHPLASLILVVPIAMALVMLCNVAFSIALWARTFCRRCS